jgi:hypothetical protein
MAEGQFDKDFGYLMPFLDKVASAASSLADATAREELMRLIADEKPRWTRIRQLLSGAQGQSQTRSQSPATEYQSSKTISRRNSDTEEPREPLSFTVGSLRKRSS